MSHSLCSPLGSFKLHLKHQSLNKRRSSKFSKTFHFSCSNRWVQFVKIHHRLYASLEKRILIIVGGRCDYFFGAPQNPLTPIQLTKSTFSLGLRKSSISYLWGIIEIRKKCATSFVYENLSFVLKTYNLPLKPVIKGLNKRESQWCCKMVWHFQQLQVLRLYFFYLWEQRRWK